ncbi:hypothetical protein SS50377_22722 [Spironucleus salmonicida]|uniref:BRO1 domain-containing protein n=1 Tax=Spironucleus salmonicida TaxID=348837 RepID=V6LTV5_9EUKA|nr:hypothetical protein SS50377_22722 [Spironucleus salmonicida]|eukprot:EST44199.1 Hypothetical protein SS50377_16005 [Spironucleus salmonicida]
MATHVTLIDIDHIYITDNQNFAEITQKLTKSIKNIPASIPEVTQFYQQFRERCRSVNYQEPEIYIGLINYASYIMNSLNFSKNRAQLTWSKTTTGNGPAVDVAAAFYNLVATNLKSAQRAADFKLKSQLLGKAVYYVHEALVLVRKTQVNSPVLNAPNLAFLETFLTAQMYETLAALQWQTNEYKGFTVWAKFISSAIQMYEKSSKIDEKRSSNSSMRLRQLQYLTSAQYQRKQGNSKQARKDAEFAQNLGADVNFAEFFDSPCEQESQFLPHFIDLDKKFEEWNVKIQLRKGEVLLDKEGQECVSEVQRILCARQADYISILNAKNELIYNQMLEASVSTKLESDIQQVEDYAARYQNAAAALPLGNELVEQALKSQAIYNEILRSDNQNLAKIGALWDSQKYQTHLKALVQELENVVQIGRQLPTCMQFLQKHPLQDVCNALTIIAGKDLSQQVSQSDIEGCTWRHEAQTVNPQLIIENAPLELTRKNAKQIAEAVAPKLPQIDNSAVEKLAQKQALSAAGSEHQLALHCQAAIQTMCSVENFLQKASEKVQRHGRTAELAFQDYVAQVQAKWDGVREGRGLTVEWKEVE